MVNEKNEAFTIKFKPSLMEKVEAYVNTVNKHKKASEKKLTKANFFNDVVNDYFKEKVLTNDYIELERPFYFNMQELKENGVVKASSEVPIYDLENCYIVNNVPNNLDVFDKNNKTYCSGNASKHKGIFIKYDVSLEDKTVPSILFDTEVISIITDITENYLLFDFNSSNNELNIGLIPFEELYLYVSSNSTILDELEKEKDDFYYNIVLDEETNEFNDIEYISSYKFVAPFKKLKDIKITVKKVKEMYNDGFDLEAVVLDDFPDGISGADYKKLYKSMKEH